MVKAEVQESRGLSESSKMNIFDYFCLCQSKGVCIGLQHIVYKCSICIYYTYKMFLLLIAIEVEHLFVFY